MLQLYVEDMKVYKSKVNRISYSNIQTDAVDKEHFSEGEIKFQGCMAEHFLRTFFTFFFFSIWVFFHEQSHFTGQQGKEEAIFLSPLYHFHPLHRHLDISRAITTARSPLHIASSWTRAGNLDSNWEQKPFIGSVFVIFKNV